jgi:hypothetical protein
VTIEHPTDRGTSVFLVTSYSNSAWKGYSRTSL